MNNNETYFANVASDWDDIRSGYFTVEMRDAAIALANLEADAVVADIGTGTGFVIEGLVNKAKIVYGFDPSAEMLAIAEQNLKAHRNVILRQAAGQQIPLPNNTVDAVFGNMYLHHETDPAAAIVELARILKPGGKLILTDLDTHSEVWMKEEMADVWLGFEREHIKSWFQEAGLNDVNVSDAAGTCQSSLPTGGAMSLTIFAAFGRKAVV